MSFPMIVALALTAPPAAELVDVRKIWDAAPHNAFTDLVRFRDQWVCVFREGKAHVSPDGALRVITSADGKEWASAARLTFEGMDLRDAKVTVTPGGKLHLSGAGALHKPAGHTHQSLVWLSDDAKLWTPAFLVGDPGYWLWRVTWHGKKCYGFGYGCGSDKDLRLYAADDPGTRFDRLAENVHADGYPNETSIVFGPGDKAVCLLRRDKGTKTGLLGTSEPPYTTWAWKDLGKQIGGPHVIRRAADGALFAVVRLYDGKHRTAVCRIDEAGGTLTELLPLPSDGDTSYAGLAWHDGLLWVSYYSSHEAKKTNIYLARVRLN